VTEREAGPIGSTMHEVMGSNPSHPSTLNELPVGYMARATTL